MSKIKVANPVVELDGDGPSLGLNELSHDGSLIALKVAVVDADSGRLSAGAWLGNACA